MVLEIFSQLFHGGHVSEQNRLYNTLTYELDLLGGEFTRQKVVIVNIKQFNTLSRMEVLLDMFFSVHLADRALGHHVVPVVVPVVLHVVAQGRDQQRQGVQVVEVGLLNHLLVV